MKRILIANRGEIARRIMRTAHAMGIETVAVFSEADANALHVREARFSHPLGGNSSADSYLRIDKLLQAAAATRPCSARAGRCWRAPLTVMSSSSATSSTVASSRRRTP